MNLEKKVQEFDNKQLWLALHTYVSSLPRDSSETFRLTRQTSRLKSRWHQNDGGNLALYHIRIPNCVICHSQT